MKQETRLLLRKERGLVPVGTQMPIGDAIVSNVPLTKDLYLLLLTRLQ